MTSLHLIRRRDRLEFKAERNAVLYRPRRSAVWHTTKTSRGTGQRPCPAGWNG